jgi:hypothetical protein
MGIYVVKPKPIFSFCQTELAPIPIAIGIGAMVEVQVENMGFVYRFL